MSSADPLSPIAQLPGVLVAAERARNALGEVHRHKANRRGWPQTATEAAIRAARSSSFLAGGSMDLAADGDIADPILAGAVRVAQSLDGDSLALVLTVWQRAPLQALARLHLLAAAELVSDQLDLGRPRMAAGVGERLSTLAQLVTGGTTVPAPILAAVVHGELAALRPFGTADDVVARAAARLVAVSTGLDPHNLGVPEVSWMRRSKDYRERISAFSEGSADGVRDWVIFCCEALESGAREATSIADAVGG
ncbi:MAG: oxidoreductase [Mycobacteriaceae bacterium]